MNDAMDRTGDPDRMCADFPAQQEVRENFEKERAAMRTTAEFEALQQMLSEAYNREMILRAEIVRLRRRNVTD